MNAGSRLARWGLCASLTSIFCLASPLSAKDVRSEFGFEVSLPDTWVALTRREVANQADVLLGRDGGQASTDRHVLDGLPSEMRAVVVERIERGELEIYYQPDAPVGTFVDNVNVMRQASTLPTSEDEIAAICRVLPREFSRVFGRPIAVDACELRDVIGRRAVYFQFDGATEGTKSLQYHLADRSGATVVLTATSATSNLSKMLGEFEAMVSSVRFK